VRAVHFTQKESHRSYGALVWGTWVALFGQRSRSRVLKKYQDERTMAAAFDDCCQQGAARRSSLEGQFRVQDSVISIIHDMKGLQNSSDVDYLRVLVTGGKALKFDGCHDGHYRLGRMLVQQWLSHLRAVDYSNASC